MALIFPIVSKFDPAGLRKAKKEFGGLGKSIKGALGVAGIAVGIGSVVNLMKDSVKAAATDAKSQKLLALQLKNTLHATKAQISATEDYVGKLAMQVGIQDDLLRPSLANAVRGTGSLAKGQKLLSLALDASAATGKPLNTVMQALIKAQNGSQTALKKLAPELTKTGGNLDDFAKSVKGAAMANADPFARMNVAVGELKEKFGRLLLPAVIKFVDYLTITVVPAVSKFLDDVANPKTDVGKAFTDIKDAVKIAFTSVRDFFALFGDGDAMKGFANMAKSLASSLPALLALKGIMTLASAGKTIANLIAAMVAIKGGGGDGVTPVVGGGKGKLGGKGGLLPLAGIAGTAALVLAIPGSSDMSIPDRAPSVPWKKGSNSVQIGKTPTVVVNSYGSTPADFVKLVHEAVKKSDRLNGTK
jgi:hypothetical protein